MITREQAVDIILSKATEIGEEVIGEGMPPLVREDMLKLMADEPPAGKWFDAVVSAVWQAGWDEGNAEGRG